MEQIFGFVLLLDIYGELLSNGQREALEMKYNEDLSLAEIADEIGGVSRQSVHYSIKHGERRLLELEEKLGFAARLKNLSGELEKADSLISEISEKYDEKREDKRFDELRSLLSAIKREL